KVDAGLRIAGIQRPSTAGGTTTYQVEFQRATPPTAALQDGITRVSSCEHWDINRTSGSGSAYITLSWAANSNCTVATPYVTSLSTLRVGHLRGGAWRSEGNFSTTGTNLAGTIRSVNAVNTFSPFALASISDDENPLPVVFANVRAYEKNNGVQIDWSNLTEKDVDHYVVERSTNGTDFSAIAQQLPTSNQDDKADYSAFDAAPKAGTNYYRIKAEETTGKIVYSKILSVNLGSTTQSLRLYPNPVTGNQVNISLSNVRSGQYDLRVVNVSGQDVLKQRISSQGSTITQTIDLPASIAPGVYNMVISGGDFRETKMFIVQ
ncbi:MAG TPA: T9SS type A sorting domain-containing protein, partial [Chitinophagaceae bacterium]|nr:T9SS type A sorting domain-containing protein [Chitinophagaceae bacterium]